jgi:hypothetical protein
LNSSCLVEEGGKEKKLHNLVSGVIFLNKIAHSMNDSSPKIAASRTSQEFERQYLYIILCYVCYIFVLSQSDVSIERHRKETKLMLVITNTTI